MANIDKIIYSTKLSEEEIQIRVVNYITIVHPDILFCASAGGVRTGYKQAVKMKRTGYKKGFPDLQICEAVGGYHGLFLELKTLKGVASPEQKQWRADLLKRGYYAIIVQGVEPCIEIIDKYLSGQIDRSEN
jgi:hypothetical protein